MVGGLGLAAAVRTARWEGPRSPGAPASELFVIGVGIVVLAAIIAAAYGLRRSQPALRSGVSPRGTGAAVDGAVALLIAAVAGAVWLVATLDFPMD